MARNLLRLLGELPRPVQCLVDEGKHRGLECISILPVRLGYDFQPNEALNAPNSACSSAQHLLLSHVVGCLI